MIRDRKDIPRFKDVADADWNDYRWQLRNRLTTTEDFESVLNLTDAQRTDLDACMGKFRVSVTPYYASLMDPDDPTDPVRMQGVPTPAELVIHAEDLEDAVSEDFDSPTPRITHRYPDRVLFVVTEMCSMYCRHCTRRRLVGGTEDIVAQTEIDNAIKYIERATEVRDVLISGGDPLVLSDEQLESIIERVRAIDHVEIIRIGSRMPVVCPQRITPELVAMLKKYQPLYFNTHFNHPQEFTAESKQACDRLTDAGIPLGNQTVLMRGINDGANVMKKLVAQAAAVPRQALLLLPVRPRPGHRPLPHQRRQGHRDLREPARPHHRLRRADLHHRRHRRRREDAGVPQLRHQPGAGQGRPAQLRGRDQQVHGARRLRRGRRATARTATPTTSGSASPACSSRPRPDAERGLGRAHAEGRRPQEPHGRHLRRGQGLRGPGLSAEPEG